MRVLPAVGGLAARVEKVTDMAAILEYGVLRTPGLVVNERLVLSGRVPSVGEIRALLDKGLPLGTVLAFMMAVTALSVPELIILRRVLRPALLTMFVAVLTVSIIAVGYLFNAVV